MPNLTFHPDVFYEVKASYIWYQKKAEGLGVDFLDELENAYQAILDYPMPGRITTEDLSDICCQVFRSRLFINT
jgi:hypothetical protein